MTTQQRSRALHIALWAVQLLLAATLLWAGATKWFQPTEKLSALWPWTGEVPRTFVKLTGVVDVFGALGLTLPSLFRTQPKLIPIAGLGVIALMVCASVFHIVRGEASGIGVNIVFAGMAAFVAWGRFKKAPIASK